MATRFFSLLIEAGTKDIYLYIDILKTKKTKPIGSPCTTNRLLSNKLQQNFT